MKAYTLRMTEEQSQKYGIAAKNAYQSKPKWMLKILDEASKGIHFGVSNESLENNIQPLPWKDCVQSWEEGFDCCECGEVMVNRAIYVMMADGRHCHKCLEARGENWKLVPSRVVKS